jgi:hypothetical protein
MSKTYIFNSLDELEEHREFLNEMLDDPYKELKNNEDDAD